VQPPDTFHKIAEYAKDLSQKDKGKLKGRVRFIAVKRSLSTEKFIGIVKKVVGERG
jgi:hypothetical protein